MHLSLKVGSHPLMQNLLEGCVFCWHNIHDDTARLPAAAEHSITGKQAPW